jgi:hypothetical protein
MVRQLDHSQVIRAMELSGNSADAEQCRALVLKASRQLQEDKTDPNPVGNQDRPGEKEGPNAVVEKLKFWIGLPNEVYSEEWP